jgi:hypothetical protein
MKHVNSHKLLRIIPLLGLLTAFGFLASCHETDKVEEEKVVPKRTVLAYIIGDNSLSSYAAPNVDSMLVGLKWGDASQINLIVYQDNKSEAPVLWKLNVDEQGTASRTEIRRFTEQNSVDKSIMSGIISDVFARYPADEKGMILWSHGTGWLPSVNYTADDSKSRAFGQDDSEWLELWDLRDVLERSKVHFDFILFDACLMANVEVAYELRNVTDNLIVSVAEIMGYGFPYQEVIERMAQPTLDLRDIGRAYMSYYDGHNDYYGGTISVINTARMEELARLYAEIVASDETDAATVGAANIQQFGRRVSALTSYRNYFYDLAKTVDVIGPDYNTRLAALLDDIVVFEDHTPTFGFTSGGGEKFAIKTCSGLSVFIPKLNPDALILSAYNRLAWTMATTTAGY